MYDIIVTYLSIPTQKSISSYLIFRINIKMIIPIKLKYK